MSGKAQEKTSEEKKFFPETDSLKKVLLGLTALFAYGLILSYAGYLITTFVFMVFILRLVEPVPWKTVIGTGLATAVISYLLFVVLLEVQLPGAWWVSEEARALWIYGITFSWPSKSAWSL